MKAFALRLALSSLACVALFGISPAFAKQDASLKEEVQLLKTKIETLEKQIQKQNNETSSTQTTESSVSPKDSGEIGNLLQGLSANPPPGDSSRSVGLWKYPINRSGAARLIPDISFIPSFAFAYFSEDPSEETGHDPARTGFTFQEIEMAIQSVIDPYFRGDIFLSFHEEGVELEEGYFTVLALPKGMGIRGGKFFIPFGRQNQKHMHNWSFADNTLVNKQLLGPEALSELGLETSYLFPIPTFLQLQATFSNGDNETSFGGERKQDFLYNARLSTSFDLSRDLTMLIGASTAIGFNASEAGNKTYLFGSDLFLRWRPSAQQSLSWQTEYIFRRMQVPGDVLNDGGLYSYIEYQFARRWRSALRYDQMGLPSSVFKKQFRITPAISFDPTEFSRIRLQYEYDKIPNQEASHAVIMQLQFSMGPHGAHPF